VKKAWKNLSVGVWAAIIGGIALILAAVIPIVYDHFRKTPNLLVIDVKPVTLKGKKAIDLVLWNKSEVAESVSSIDLVLKDIGPPVNAIGRTVYGITADVAVGTGQIQGSATDTIVPTVSLPVSGNFTTLELTGWGLDFLVTVREEIEPGHSHRVILILPEDVRIVGDSPSLSMWMDPLKEYITTNPPQIHLAQFLKARGRIDLEILVTYGKGEISQYEGEVSF
jgi:hypothetical protein